MRKLGLLIVLEGIDGSGKTTLAKNLCENLDFQKITTQYLHEPTHSEYGLKIRKYLKGEFQLSKQELIDLFLLDRNFSVKENILPNLEKGVHVVLDRYFYSMAAYQGDEEFSPLKILQMNLEKNFPAPNVLFFLDIPPEIAYERIQTRSERQEAFDSIVQLERISKNYKKILPPNVNYLDAKKNPKEILEKCLLVINEELKLHNLCR